LYLEFTSGSARVIIILFLKKCPSHVLLLVTSSLVIIRPFGSVTLYKLVSCLNLSTTAGIVLLILSLSKNPGITLCILDTIEITSFLYVSKLYCTPPIFIIFGDIISIRLLLLLKELE